MVNNIQLTWKLAWLLRAYKTCNSTVRFSKYEFHNKLLGGVTLFRVILCITWIQHTHTHTYIYIDSHSSLGIRNTTSSCAKVVSGYCVPIRSPGSTFGLVVSLGLSNCTLGCETIITHVSPFFFLKKKSIRNLQVYLIL